MRTTWAANAVEPFWQPITTAASSFADGARALGRRLLGRRDGTAHHVTVNDTTSVIDHVTARCVLGPLDPDLPVAEAVATLDARVRAIC
jgi:hypothetical protein